MDNEAKLALRLSHSTDSSIFQVIPQDVVFPQTVEDVKQIVKDATELGQVLSVRAGGTCMSGSSLSKGLIINMTEYMNKITVQPYTKSAVIEMGAFYRDLELETKKHDLLFAPYTSSKDTCGIGGMIGNNASGEKSVRHGAVIDNIHSVEVVLYDGQLYTFENINEESYQKIMKEKTVLGSIYRQVRELYDTQATEYRQAVGQVRKASSGYRLERIYDEKTATWNLGKLFIGAQATLGIVASARLKLVDVPVYTRTVVIPIDDLSLLPDMLEIIMRHNPEGVETFDMSTFIHAKKFLPDDCARTESFFSKGERLIVLAQFSEATQQKTDEMAHSTVMTLKSAHKTSKAEYMSDLAVVTSLWNIRRSAYRVLRDTEFDVSTKKAVPCIEDIIVPVSRYDVFIPRLISLLESHSVEYGFHGHIGDGALRVIPIIDFVNKQAAVNLITTLCKDVFALVKELGGNTSADHGDGIIRTPFLQDFYGGELYRNVIIKLKTIFDPKNIFNSDKKIGIQIEDLFEKVRWGNSGEQVVK